MLIFLNGFPGTGKLTIGQALMDRLGGRLLDVHTQMNIAYALTEFKSEAFYDTVRAIWKITDGLIADLPADTPLILTDALREGSDSSITKRGSCSWVAMPTVCCRSTPRN